MTPGSVSVVIPTYNRPRLLLEALASVRSQSHRPEEIIVVDDGGTVPHAAELLALAAHGDVLLLQQDNRGTAGAMNRGARAASSEFLLFTGDDDIVVPGAIAGLRAALIETPEAVAAAGGSRNWFAEEDRLSEVLWPSIERGEFEDFLHACPFSAGAVLVRRRAFEQVGGFEEALDITEDWDLYLRLSRLGRFVLPRVEALHYRRHRASLTADLHVARTAANLAQHYLRQFDRDERRRYGPPLATGVVHWYARQTAWALQRALKRGDIAHVARAAAVLVRIVRLCLRFPESRIKLIEEWRRY